MKNLFTKQNNKNPKSKIENTTSNQRWAFYKQTSFPSHPQNFLHISHSLDIQAHISISTNYFQIKTHKVQQYPPQCSVLLFANSPNLLSIIINMLALLKKLLVIQVISLSLVQTLLLVHS